MALHMTPWEGHEPYMLDHSPDLVQHSSGFGYLHFTVEARSHPTSEDICGKKALSRPTGRILMYTRKTRYAVFEVEAWSSGMPLDHFVQYALEKDET